MVKYECDWCGEEFPIDRVSAVRVGNVFNDESLLHVCQNCGKDHFPNRVQALISWTAPINEDNPNQGVDKSPDV